MTQLKRRISILLCFLLVFTTVFVAAPMEAQAATTTYLGVSSSNIITYVDADNFYAGDFVYAYAYTYDSKGNYVSYKDYGYLSMNSGVTYKSSNTKVAKIDKNGLLDIKAKGTTTITVKFKKQTVKFDIKVLKKNDFFNEMKSKASYNDWKKLASNADKTAKAYLKEIGKNPDVLKGKNRYDILSAYNQYESVSNGFTSFHTLNPSTNTYEINSYYYSPTAHHVYRLDNKIASDLDSINPFSTYSAKHFAPKSISGKGKTITVTLKSKVDDTMLLGANGAFSWDTEVKASKKYTFPIIVMNTSNNREYYGIATIEKGSKKMTIELKNHKLVKGKKYQLVAKTGTGRYGSYLGNWLDTYTGKIKTTFTAK